MKREEAKKIYGEELVDITNEWWRDYKIGWWEMRIINRGKKIEKKDPVEALLYLYSKLVPFGNRKALYATWFHLWENTPFSTRLEIGQIAKDCSVEDIERGLKREREKK